MFDVVWEPSPNFHQGRTDTCTGRRVEKPTMLVMHYTVAMQEGTFNIYQNPNSQVSTHYTIGETGTVHQHVDEEGHRSWHAGRGQWRGVPDVNSYSVSITHVNAGFRESPDQPAGVIVPGSALEWYEFQREQIRSSVALAEKIVRRYGIEPRNVFGHADSAVGRHVNPGPLFPWSEYARRGVGAWIFDAAEEADDFEKIVDDEAGILAAQKKLHLFGYTGVPTNGRFDEATQKTVVAFQMHYRQKNISGRIDKGTVRMMDALLEKYP